jgi:hypothetical protein
VRRFAADGRALTGWIHIPPHRSPTVATADVVVLAHVQDVSLLGERWRPTTGEAQPLPSTCYGGWAAAGRTIVPLPCVTDRVVTTIDAVTGTMRRVRLVRPVTDTSVEAYNPLSPDGHQLAVVVQRIGVRPGLLDLRTGHFRATPVDPTLGAVSWSPDGQWVLLSDSGSFGNGHRPRIALWRPSDGALTSVRLPVGTSLDYAAQLLTTSLL